MNITLRHETPADVGAIATLTAAAFLHAEHSSHTEQFIVNALRAAGALTLSLVAEHNGTPLGHASVSPVALSNGAVGWFGLAPVSVLPACQNLGIGSRLIRRLLAELQERGAAGCVVLGEPSYYGRFGFQAQDALTLPGVPQDYFRAIAFQGALPCAEVTFHNAFNAEA
ncbi:GNAT family N-acetyltransferase [Serratia marcescens]|uniref:GNAT family N-acetyltransferase n=1 Tax=Serratia marcescens TaxID=615 RepID=UPI0002AF25D0|nr:N-acetyltransferase [Serratia marcescens]AGE17318.1 acetyltransferase [Serratia marcescens WW4]HEI9791519.1 N-acetyltransferase [Serratia marcescens]